MRTWFLALALLAGPARAEADDGWNVLIGPVFGLQFGGKDGPHGMIGVEGGVGAGPERVNVGLEYRDAKLFGYGELDPWYLLGMTFGFGVDSDGVGHGVAGLWEGVPLVLAGCEVHGGDFGATVTLSVGVRYTGVRELYVALKAGGSQRICLDLR